MYHGVLLEPVESDIEVIVPARTLNELSRLLGDQEDAVEIMMTPAKGQVLFRVQGVELVSQLLQGAFPNYDQLIPQKYDTRAVFDLQGLLRATRTAAIFARDGLVDDDDGHRVLGIGRSQDTVPGCGTDTRQIMVTRVGHHSPLVKVGNELIFHRPTNLTVRRVRQNIDTFVAREIGTNNVRARTPCE